MGIPFLMLRTCARTRFGQFFCALSEKLKYICRIEVQDISFKMFTRSSGLTSRGLAFMEPEFRLSAIMTG
jgi:hypothetical protein